MSTIWGRQVRFKVYPQDHEPCHVHGVIGEGMVIVELREDRTVVLADRPDAIRNARRREVRLVLLEALELYDSLVEAWKEMHT